MSQITHVKVKFACDNYITVIPITDMVDFDQETFDKNGFDKTKLYKALWKDEKNKEGIKLGVQIGGIAQIVPPAQNQNGMDGELQTRQHQNILDDEVPPAQNQNGMDGELQTRQHQNILDDEVPPAQNQNGMDGELQTRQHQNILDDEVPPAQNQNGMDGELQTRQHQNILDDEVPPAQNQNGMDGELQTRQHQNIFDDEVPPAQNQNGMDGELQTREHQNILMIKSHEVRSEIIWLKPHLLIGTIKKSKKWRFFGILSSECLMTIFRILNLAPERHLEFFHRRAPWSVLTNHVEIRHATPLTCPDNQASLRFSNSRGSWERIDHVTNSSPLLRNIHWHAFRDTHYHMYRATPLTIGPFHDTLLTEIFKRNTQQLHQFTKNKLSLDRQKIYRSHVIRWTWGSHASYAHKFYLPTANRCTKTKENDLRQQQGRRQCSSNIKAPQAPTKIVLQKSNIPSKYIGRQKAILALCARFRPKFLRYRPLCSCAQRTFLSYRIHNLPHGGGYVFGHNYIQNPRPLKIAARAQRGLLVDDGLCNKYHQQ
ncbi:unnamed protein product [Trichogramma brassicae]|uniref:Uncharacterized protein n=1 Tax=Trichogramma brassicae TaxID=86971 RepID=A0A6H5J3R0_9HYME|nr:unnamed protein product [Trichogramma brassicae]